MRWVSGVLVALAIAYPFGVYVALPRISAWWILVGIAAIIALRGVFLQRQLPSRRIISLFSIALAVLFVFASFDQVLAVKMYPVFASYGMAAAFAYTIFRPPSMVERVARKIEPRLNKKGVVYCQRVSWLWVIFGIVNGTISLGTALLGTLEIWTLYNGLIAYLGMALLFAGEYTFRQFVKADHVGEA